MSGVYGHDHSVPPLGEVRMHMTECDHGEPFVCITDLVLWLDRMPIDPMGERRKNEFRNSIVDYLTWLSFDYLLNEDGLT